jgi:hypothetical protein
VKLSEDVVGKQGNRCSIADVSNCQTLSENDLARLGNGKRYCGYAG